uniref:Uncharacterized protein n=1 Tax=Romanomermis culicivorax TaxID=13658 RepID=A0A915HKV7_ROMCU
MNFDDNSGFDSPLVVDDLPWMEIKLADESIEVAVQLNNNDIKQLDDLSRVSIRNVRNVGEHAEH